jgi:Dynamin family
MDTQPPAPERERIHAAILRAADIAATRDEPITSSRLVELADRLEGAEFNVVVVGAFKRGKSTVVNALLGTSVLPTGVLPLTSVVTRIRWGPRSTAGVRSTDGSSRPIPVEELDAFVTETANPGNHRGVVSAEVRVPVDLLRSGGVIVDTPGVGSTLAHNTDTTLRFLEDVDAAVFVTSPDPPISDEERRFLIAVEEQARATFYVLNKVDRLADEDLTQVLGFTRSVIADVIGHQPEVFPLSARRALESGDPGFERFAEALAAFLDQDLADTGLASVVRKANDAVGRVRAGIELELGALRLSVQEIARRREGLAEVRRRAESVRRELDALVAADGREQMAWVGEELAAWRGEETDRLLLEAERAMAERTVAPAELGHSLDDALRADIADRRPTFEAEVRARSTASREELVERARSAADDAVAAAAEVLDLALPPPPPIEGLAEHSRFSFAFFEVPTVMESLLPDAAAILPAPWARAVALRRARRRIPIVVDRHAGRIRHDLATRLQESADALRRALDRQLAATTEGLDEALAGAERRAGSLATSETEAAAALGGLDRELASLAAQLVHRAAPLIEERTS